MVLKVLFKTGTVTVTENETPKAVEVTEWKQAGSKLVMIVDKPAKDEKDKQIELISGDFVDFSADRQSIFALVPGYPSVVINEGESVDRVTVELKPIISVSEDGWTVSAKLFPPLDGREPPDVSEILSMLEKEGITYGIREKKISLAVDMAVNRSSENIDEVIVRGRLPVNGEDARLNIHIAFGEIAGREDEEGTIDYKEKNLFIGVEKGELLANRVDATDGLPGVNIYGHEVPQIIGKELSFSPGPDVVFNTETGELISAMSGVVSAVNDNSVKITDKLNISGEVDYNTGNIDCRGGVEISGSVMPNFKVAAGGDMIIGGNIESAQIVCKGNVIVKGGMIGKDSEISAVGSVDILFAEAGIINCGGTVTVNKEVYFTEIYSGRSIEFEEETAVIGSRLISGASIQVMDVDTDSSPVSQLAAAVDHKRYERYLGMQGELSGLEAKVKMLRRRLGPGGTNEALESLEEELDGAIKELDAFNLVPASPEDDAAGGLRFACKQKIVIKGKMQPGVNIRIGNSEIKTNKAMKKGYFSLVAETGEIVYQSEKKIELKVP